MKNRGFISLFLVMLAGFAFAAIPERSKPSSKNTNPQRLSYGNVVSHFKAARLRTTEVQPRCAIFFEGEWKNPTVYDYSLMIVENSDEDIQVTFYLTDAHEMNWVTEFLDAPFFSRDETEKLFNLLYSAGDARDRKIGRFRVDFHHWQPKHAVILAFSFSPIR